MKDKVNTYFAVLLITVAGAAAAWLIVHFTYTETLTAIFNGSEANYASLQQSILNQ